MSEGEIVGRVVRYVVEEIVDDASSVEVEVVDDGEDAVLAEVRTAKKDMGRVIGRRGRVARAIRTVARRVRAGARRGVHPALAPCRRRQWREDRLAAVRLELAPRHPSASLANPSDSLCGDEAFSARFSGRILRIRPRLERGELPPRDPGGQLISLHSRPLGARWPLREI